MNKNNYYVDIHVLQTLPPSCVNRDDTGSPKTAMFGGVNRARVSSQCWKHAIRKTFKEKYDSSWNWNGNRTFLILPKVSKYIMEKDHNINEKDAEQLAIEAFNKAGVEIKDFSKEIDGVKSGPKALFFISDAQASRLAEAIIEDERKKQAIIIKIMDCIRLIDNNAVDIEKKAKKIFEENDVKSLSDDSKIQQITRKFLDNEKKAKEEKKEKKEKKEKRYVDILHSEPSVDIALFGRMVADNNDLNYDACVQVAHSISTHEVRTEYDYFTAEDDCKKEGGAGHLNTNEFNSSTLYRYATINIKDLEKEEYSNINISEAIRGFTEAFIRSIPTGKDNSHAHNTIPDMVYIAIRDDQPINLVGAFEKPVVANNNGYFLPSEEAFSDYAKETYEKFIPKPIFSCGVSRGVHLSEITEVCSLTEILNNLEKFVIENIITKQE